MRNKTKTLVVGGVLIVAAFVLCAAILFLGPGAGTGDGAGAPQGDAAQTAGANDSQLTVVRGVIGSEKQSLFDDPDAQAVFAKHGLQVQVTTSGSWAMAERDGIEQSDFASPSSEIAAQHLEDVHKGAVKAVTKPFFSPLAIATSQTVLGVLQQNGIARQTDGVWYLDVKAYLDAVAAGKRWTDLQGSDAYPSSRNIMITSTDIRSSNSALMYLALASYVANGNAVVTSEDAARTQAQDTLSKLFLDQGYSQSSSAGPWESFLSKGPMNQPLTLIYESQYVEALINKPSRITSDMRIAYLAPTIYSDHVVVAFSDAGQKVQDILDHDPDMAKVIARHGFRPNGDNSAAFGQAIKDAGIDASGMPAADAFVDTAQTPSYEVMDAMLTTIKDLY